MKIGEVGMGGRNESAVIRIDQGRSQGKKRTVLQMLVREVLLK